MTPSAGGRRPLRVLIVGPYPRTPDRIDGGVAAAVMYLSQALASLTDVELVSVRIAKGAEDACDSRKFDWPIVDLQLGRLGLTTLYVRQKRRFREIVDHYKPDIVHGQESDIAGYLAVNCGYPDVLTVHGILGACARLQSDPVNRARAILAARVTERHSIRRASNLIAISSYITRYYGSDVRGHVHRIPNAVAPAFFGVARSAQRGRLLYAGRISNGKGLVELIEAFARSRLAHSRLVLAGSAPDPAYEDFVKGEARRLGVARHVQFAGLLDERALLEELSSAQALVLPSHQETAPMVIQEAMAAGVAVIATSVGGVPEQVQHDLTGLLCRPGDIDGLTAAITRLADDSELANRFGAAAKERAEMEYKAEAVANSTLQVYRGIVAGTSLSARSGS